MTNKAGFAGHLLSTPFPPMRLTLAGGGEFRLGKGDLYFIGADAGPVKIGASNNPQARLRGLQTAYPYKLRLLAVLPDGGPLEAEFHERFAEHRLHGEWFERSPSIESEIERLGGGV